VSRALLASLIATMISGACGGGTGRLTCDTLAATAADAPPDPTGAAWVEGIWSTLVPIAVHLDPDFPPTRLAVLGASATRPGGDALESGAWTCQSSGVVYVSDALVRYTRERAAEGEDFMAFVLAHELAHRRFDRGDAALGEDCPDADSTIEQLADHRATFLVAQARRPRGSAGVGGRYAPFRLGGDAGLRAFFRGELGWTEGCPALAERVGAVTRALASFETYQALHEVTTSLVAVGRPEMTIELLRALVARIGEVGDRESAAVPELHVLLAVAHLDRAQRESFWPRSGPSLGQLPCLPVLPTRSALSAFDERGPRGPSSIERFVVRDELAEAGAALDEAIAGGVDPAALEGLRMCIALVGGDPVAARLHLERFDATLATRGPTPEGFARVLAGNRALVRLGELVFRAGVDLEPEAFRREAERALPTLVDHPRAQARLRHWLRPESGGDPRGATTVGVAAEVLDTLAAARQELIAELERASREGAATERLSPELTLRTFTHERLTLREVMFVDAVGRERRYRVADVAPPPEGARALKAWRAACRSEPVAGTDVGAELSVIDCDDDGSWLVWSRDGLSAERVTRVEGGTP